MLTNNRITHTLLTMMVLLLAGITLRIQDGAIPSAYAQGARFDHITVISTMFLYKGERGLLLLDKRNGNAWFMPQSGEEFGKPTLITRVPFELLDQEDQRSRRLEPSAISGRLARLTS